MIKTRKAAMPVPYIIALILGVVVVAVLAYWFVSSGSKGGGVGKEAECRARMLEWCTLKTPDITTKINEACDPDPTMEKLQEFCKAIPGLGKS